MWSGVSSVHNSPSIYSEDKIQASSHQGKTQTPKIQRPFNTLESSYPAPFYWGLTCHLKAICSVLLLLDQRNPLQSLTSPAPSALSSYFTVPHTHLTSFTLKFAPETLWELSCHNQVLMPDNYLESLETQSKHLPLLKRLKPKHLENNVFFNKYLWKYSQLKIFFGFLYDLLIFTFLFWLIFFSVMGIWP